MGLTYNGELYNTTHKFIACPLAHVSLSLRPRKLTSPVAGSLMFGENPLGMRRWLASLP